MCRWRSISASHRQRVNTIASFDAGQKYGVKTEGSATAASTEMLSELAELVASGRITIPVAATYPLDQVASAYEEPEKRHTHGKSS